MKSVLKRAYMKLPQLRNPRFEIKSLIGEGSVGVVYLAEDLKRKESVALKLLKSDLPAQQRAAFKHEFWLLTQLSHPCLGKIYDFFDDDGECGPYFSMEFVRGAPFSLFKKKLAKDQALQLLLRLSSALQYLHSKNILHRDLKPANLILSDEGGVKLVDFGLAAIRAASESPREAEIHGTLAYMAPEALEGKYEAVTDLFAMGVLLYEHLAGRLPYTRPLSRRLDEIRPPPSLARIRPDLPLYLCEIVHKLIRLAPSERPSSALSVRKYLSRHVDAIDPEEKSSLLPSAVRLPLVGRRAPLEAFRDFIQKKEGLGIVRVSGPTGVGKSRFLEEAKWAAQLLGRRYTEVKPPSSGDWRSPHSASQSKEWEGLEGIVAFTDLHLWEENALDEISKHLCFLEISQKPVKVVLEYDESGVQGRLSELLSALRDLYGPGEIRLLPLTQDEQRELLEKALAEFSIDWEDKEALILGSGGLPLLLFEALRKGPGFPIPKSLKDAADMKISSLPPDARELLALCVSHPRPVSIEDALDISRLKEERFSSALHELDSKGLFRARDASNAKLETFPSSLKEVYAGALSPEEILEAHGKWLSASRRKEFDPRAMAVHAFGASNAALSEKWGQEAARIEYEQGNLKSSIKWYHALIPVSKEPAKLAFVYAKLSHLHYLRGEFASALEAYEKWRKFREDDPSRLQYLKYLFYTALTHYSAGAPEAARERLMRARELGDGSRFPAHRPFLARCLNLLGAIELRLGNADFSKSLLEEAKGMSDGDPILLGEIERRLGDFETHRIQLPDAVRHYRESAARFASRGFPQGENISRHSLAVALMQQGQFEEALPHLQATIEFAKASGEILEWARYRQNLGLWQLEKGLYSSAEETMAGLKPIFKILGTEKDDLISDLHGLAVLLYGGNWSRLDDALRAAEIRRPSMERHGLWGSLLAIKAEAHYYRGDFPAAIGLFEASRESFAARGDNLGALRSGVGACRASLRLTGELPEAPYLTPTLSALAACPFPSYLLWQKLFATLHVGRGSASDEDILGFLDAVNRCERVESRMDALNLLAGLLARRGETELAERLMRCAFSILEEVKKSLSEETAMDFEKNRNLQALEKGLEKIAPALPAPRPPLEVQPARAHVGEARFRQFMEINLQIAKQNNLGAVLERVMDAAIELTGSERGFLLLRKEGTTDTPVPGFQVESARHLQKRSLSQEEFNLSMTAVRHVLQSGNFLITDDAQLDPRFHDKSSVYKYRLRSILVAPLELEGEVMGTIYLDHQKADCFSDEDVMLLKAFSAQAALAIEKARMIEELNSSQRSLADQVENQAKHIQLLSTELTQIKDDLKYDYREIIGQSPPMMKVFQLLDHVTDTAIPVWIFGESGTGKELVARSLHFNSGRRDHAFVTENVSTIPETLLESELFGHKRGSFTHADKDRIGLFEQANGGTLFLDEIADMSLGMQVKLLRVLQEGEVRPLGSNKKVKVNVRLVTASNRDLAKLVKEGKFRQDLFFRLNGLTIKLPPLRDRKEDIPLLVNHLIQKIAREFHIKPTEVSNETYPILFAHSWPGNIRELEGVLRNAMLFAKGNPITPDLISLNASIFELPSPATQASHMPAGEEEDERTLLIDSLRRHRLDKKAVAKELSISLRTLYSKLEKLGIPKKKTLLLKFLGLA